MAEKTVTVRLRALVDDYKRQMAGAGKATADVATQANKWKTLGQSTAALGDSLTRNLTLPIAAVGIAAVKMSTDFDSAFVRMQTLAGVSASEVDALKESVLGLAGETGRAPMELAEALYFLNSSGLDSAQAMEALEASAKASAAGLGNTATIADAVSSAMNAYAASGLEAAEATDVLIATARSGKAEPEQLAGALGRVLPVAAQLGVEFEEVGGAIASLSLTGNDANQSVTLLSNVMSKLIKPSQQGAEALESVGLSVEQVQAMIKDKGLIETLNVLRQRLGDNGFVKFLEDQQAVVGALALTGDNLQSTRQILDEVADSAGATDAAFAMWAESMGAKNARAWAEFQAQLIRLGDVIAPIASQILGMAGDVVGAFGKLPKPVQTAVIALGLFAAAIGPLLSIGGRLVSLGANIYTALVAMAAPAGTVSGAFNRSADAAAGMTGAFGKIPRAARIAALGIGAVVAAAVALDILTKRNEQQAEGWLESRIGDVDTEKLASVKEAIRDVKAELDELDDREGKGRLFSIGGTNIFGTEGDRERQDRIDATREKLAELEAQEESLEAQQAESAAAFVGTTDAVAGMDEATTEAVNALQAYSDAVAAQMDPLFGMVDALQGNAEAQAEVVAAQQAVNEARAAGDPEALTEAERRLADAHRAAAGTALDVTSATAQLTAGIEAGTVSVSDAKAQLRTWVDQGLISRDTANRMAAAFDTAAAKADKLAGDYKVTVSGSENVRAMVDRINDKMAQLHDKTLTIRTHFVSTGQGGSGGIPLGARAEGGPVGAGRLYEVAERGRAELLRMGSHTYLIPGADGQVIAAETGRMEPASSFAGAAGAAGVALEVHITGSGGLAQLVQRAVRNGEIQLTANGQKVRAA